jgi:hypothetical protein
MRRRCAARRAVSACDPCDGFMFSVPCLGHERLSFSKSRSVLLYVGEDRFLNRYRYPFDLVPWKPAPF